MSESKSPANAVIACRGLARSFVEADLSVDVLANVDFEVKAGERVAIVGASGSGKSTLLRYLLALERPTSGSIRVLGTDVSSASRAEMYELLGRVAPVIEIPEAYHHVMLDQPLLLVTGLRTLLADWQHSTPHTRP